MKYTGHVELDKYNLHKTSTNSSKTYFMSQQLYSDHIARSDFDNLN